MMSVSNDKKKRAVIILSGGLDSTTCMGLAKEAGYELYPISFDYGQRHKIEIENAKQVAEHYGVSGRHKIIKLDFLRDFGGSALTDDSIDVPNVVDGLTEGSEESEIP
ncbi:7-cyano-7-deazaguanine synthase, partial [Paenibacillus sp. TAF58]